MQFNPDKYEKPANFVNYLSGYENTIKFVEVI